MNEPDPLCKWNFSLPMGSRPSKLASILLPVRRVEPRRPMRNRLPRGTSDPNRAADFGTDSHLELQAPGREDECPDSPQVAHTKVLDNQGSAYLGSV
jgi:hypothetical protein